MDGFLLDFSRRCMAAYAESCALRPLVDEAMDHFQFKAFILSHEGTSGELMTAGSYDDRHVRAIVCDPVCKAAPILRPGRGNNIPFFWEASQYLTNKQSFSHLFQMSLDIGYERGVSMRVAGALGESNMLVAIYRWKTKAMEDALAELNMALMVIAPYALHAYRCRDGERNPTHFSLTQREQECLAWCAQGKTAWETSRIIGRSERTVTFHLQNAMRKLRVSSKQQAMVKAIKNGLISA